jgi:hypothetical protein
MLLFTGVVVQAQQAIKPKPCNKGSWCERWAIHRPIFGMNRIDIAKALSFLHVFITVATIVATVIFFSLRRF